MPKTSELTEDVGLAAEARVVCLDDPETSPKTVTVDKDTMLAWLGISEDTYTDEDARDAIAAALVAGTGITITPNDLGDTITISFDTVAAEDIAFTPAGDVAATDVQAAIEELDSEKAVIGSTVALGALGSTETIDASTATRFTGTIDANLTLTVSNLSTVFDVILVELTESGGGGHSIAWSGAVNTPDTHSDTDGDRSLFAVSYTADGPFVQLVGTWTP